MRLIKFYNENTVRVRLDTVEDLWSIQRIIFKDDIVSGKSERRFKANEDDKSDRKDIFVTIRVERTEFDRDALRLRVFGVIVGGTPQEYIQLRSHHTINAPPHYELEITKQEWSDYLVRVIKDAVSDTRRPRLGIIVLDEEKALSASLLGYGVKFGREIYSGLSKRMSQKDFKIQQDKFYLDIIKEAASMEAGTVIIASPGFTKDSVRDYIANNPKLRPEKDIIFEPVSNAERSGVYEIIKSKRIEGLLKRERIRREFIIMEEFLKGLGGGTSRHGAEAVRGAMDEYAVSTIIVNDSVLGDRAIQVVLREAERRGIKIEVFNSLDEVGEQLHAFNDIASIHGG